MGMAGFPRDGTGSREGDSWLASMLGLCLKTAKMHYGGGRLRLPSRVPGTRTAKGRAAIVSEESGWETAVEMAWTCGYAKTTKRDGIPVSEDGGSSYNSYYAPDHLLRRMASFARDHPHAVSAMTPVVDRMSAALSSAGVARDDRVVLSRIAARHLLVSPIMVEGWDAPSELEYPEPLADDDAILAAASAGTFIDRKVFEDCRLHPIRGVGDGYGFMSMLAHVDDGALESLLRCSARSLDSWSGVGHITHDLPFAILYCMPDDGNTAEGRIRDAVEAADGIGGTLPEIMSELEIDDSIVPFITRNSWMRLKDRGPLSAMALEFMLTPVLAEDDDFMTSDPAAADAAVDMLIRAWDACERGEAPADADAVKRMLEITRTPGDGMLPLPDTESVMELGGYGFHRHDAGRVGAAVSMWYFMWRIASTHGHARLTGYEWDVGNEWIGGHEWTWGTDMPAQAMITDVDGFCRTVVEEGDLPARFVETDIERFVAPMPHPYTRVCQYYEGF